MIPEIGILIGAYVITRMVDLVRERIREFHGLWSVLIVALALLTIVVAAAVSFDLFVRAASGSGTNALGELGK